MVAFDIPARGQCQYEGRRLPRAHRFVTMEWAVSAGLPVALATSYMTRMAAPSVQRMTNVPTYRAVSPDSVGPVSSWTLLLLYEAAGLGFRCFRMVFHSVASLFG